MILYAIEMDGKYLQSVEANNRYPKSATAPTMGTRYTYSDFRTVWGEKARLFEYHTASGHINVIFQEFRWKDRKPDSIRIIPVETEKFVKEWDFSAADKSVQKKNNKAEKKIYDQAFNSIFSPEDEAYEMLCDVIDGYFDYAERCEKLEKALETACKMLMNDRKPENQTLTVSYLLKQKNL